MKTDSITLTVYYDGQFWVGVFEKQSGRQLQVCKVTFGAEPSSAEIYDYYLNHFNELEFTTITRIEKPKITTRTKMKKLISKALQNTGVATKSQQAIKKQIEERKIDNKIKNKKINELNKALKFNQKQLKKKEKHNGH